MTHVAFAQALKGRRKEEYHNSVFYSVYTTSDYISTCSEKYQGWELCSFLEYRLAVGRMRRYTNWKRLRHEVKKNGEIHSEERRGYVTVV